MRVIPKKCKIDVEFVKGFSMTDLMVAFVAMAIVILLVVSNIPFRMYISGGVLIIGMFLLAKLDENRSYVFLFNMLKHLSYVKRYEYLDFEPSDSDKEEKSTLSPEQTDACQSDNEDSEGGEYFIFSEDGSEVWEEFFDVDPSKLPPLEELVTTTAASIKKYKKKRGKKSKKDPRFAMYPTEDAYFQSLSFDEKTQYFSDKLKCGELDELEILRSLDQRTQFQLRAMHYRIKNGLRSKKVNKIKKKAEKNKAKNVNELDARTENLNANKKPDKKLSKRQAKKQELKEAELKADEQIVGSGRKPKRVKPEICSQGKGKEKLYDVKSIIPFTDIMDSFIDYNGQYYGVVIGIPQIEFNFFSEFKQNNIIDKTFGSIIRSISADFAGNLVKIERPVVYDGYIVEEKKKIREIELSYINGVFSEEEYKLRLEIILDRINKLENLCYNTKTVQPFFYFVLYDKNKEVLTNRANQAIKTFQAAGIDVKRLNDKEIAVFLRYNYEIDFDEREIEEVEPEDYVEFAYPEKIKINTRTVQVNNMITHNFKITSYPTLVYNAWGARLFEIPGTKVVMKFKPIDRTKAIRSIDRSIDELRSQEMNTAKSSKLIELSTHIDTLSDLLVTLNADNETLLEVNIYITVYDVLATMNDPVVTNKPEYTTLISMKEMKKNVKRQISELTMRVTDMMYKQMNAFVGSQVSGYDPEGREGHSIHSTSVAAVLPFVFPTLSDKKGINIGSTAGVPTFIDFFRRDNERVNSNMVIIGKSGSGKSYATKTLLSNLAAENSKIFVLDPENEYSEMASNVNGKIINAGNAMQGRINPFHIITTLEDDEGDREVKEGASESSSATFSAHLQFLEEFFKQILQNINPDAMEYLNTLIVQLYKDKGIDDHTNLSQFRAQDFPIFDDLYNKIIAEFERSESEYVKNNLRILMNYVAKFSKGGRNAELWNGYSSISTIENFIVFNFQSLLANRNPTISNAQMLLILKWLDNEVIKNREYNMKYNASRKIVIVVDEAHVFIDEKFPIALDFMFQLAKRIRKYNGMQIVITQNVKDFVGTEEIARKSTAIINACQYSFIFSLAPNDMNELCVLYEKAGGINEIEQEKIINAPRGSAFVVTSPVSRTFFSIQASDMVQQIFGNRGYQTSCFDTERAKELLEKNMFYLRLKREQEHNKQQQKRQIKKRTRDLNNDDSKRSVEDVSSQIVVFPEKYVVGVGVSDSDQSE